jgi:hypothetical protein
MSWLRLIPFTVPLVVVVWKQCDRMDISPVLPLLGLVLGLVVEEGRKCGA